jgi:hypothetical protein
VEEQMITTRNINIKTRAKILLNTVAKALLFIFGTYFRDEECNVIVKIYTKLYKKP